MAGHSKWKNIKHKKANVDALKSKRFTKLLKEITICAKQGGGDKDSNPTLRTLLEKANEINMPKDNYLRAIKKGTGELEGSSYEEHMYEGYAQFGIAIIVTVLTDNKNRAASEIRGIFQRNSGSLGEAGSVLWMFEKKALIEINHDTTINEDELLNILLEFDIVDVEIEENRAFIVATYSQLQSIVCILKQNFFKIEEDKIGFYSKNKIELDSEQEDTVLSFIELLEGLDDVQDVYSNLK